MAFTLIANTGKGANPNPSIVITDPIDTTGAKLIVVSTGQFIITTAFQFTDSKGNTWIPLTAHGPSYQIRGFYCINPIVGAGHTFQLSGGTYFIYPVLCVQAWSAVGVISFDLQNGAFGAASTTIAPGAIVPSQNNSLVVSGVIGNQAGHITSIDSGFTITNTVISFLSDSLSGGMAYLLQGSAASLNPIWTGTQLESCWIASFIETAPPTPEITLGLASGSGVAGSTVSLDLSITSTGGLQATAVQWTFAYPTDLTLVSVTIGAAGTSAVKTLSQAGNLCIVAAIGTNNNIIGNGVLATVVFQIAAHPLASFGTVSITAIAASDSEANLLASLGVPGTITFTAAPGTLTLACPLVHTGSIGVAFSAFLIRTGGTGPFVFSINSGSIPPWSTLNTSTGEIHGIPNVAGSWTYGAKVVDSLGNMATT